MNYDACHSAMFLHSFKKDKCIVQNGISVEDQTRKAKFSCMVLLNGTESMWSQQHTNIGNKESKVISLSEILMYLKVHQANSQILIALSMSLLLLLVPVCKVFWKMLLLKGSWTFLVFFL